MSVPRKPETGGGGAVKRTRRIGRMRSVSISRNFSRILALTRVVAGRLSFVSTRRRRISSSFSHSLTPFHDPPAFALAKRVRSFEAVWISGERRVPSTDGGGGGAKESRRRYLAKVSIASLPL